MSPRQRLPGADLLFSNSRPAQAQEAVDEKKATFYLPLTLIDEIEDMQVTARKQGVRVGKSDLVVAALRQALHDHPDELLEQLRREAS